MKLVKSSVAAMDSYIESLNQSAKFVSVEGENYIKNINLK